MEEKQTSKRLANILKEVIFEWKMIFSINNSIAWLKKTAGKRSKDFQKIVRMDKKHE